MSDSFIDDELLAEFEDYQKDFFRNNFLLKCDEIIDGYKDFMIAEGIGWKSDHILGRFYLRLLSLKANVEGSAYDEINRQIKANGQLALFEKVGQALCDGQVRTGPYADCISNCMYDVLLKRQEEIMATVYDVGTQEGIAASGELQLIEIFLNQA